MRYARCKCENVRHWTSMGIPHCSWCEKCKTTPAFGPNSHSTERPKHKLIKTKVKTDDGHGELSLCLHCHQTKEQLDKLNEPYEY